MLFLEYPWLINISAPFFSSPGIDKSRISCDNSALCESSYCEKSSQPQILPLVGFINRKNNKPNICSFFPLLLVFLYMFIKSIIHSYWMKSNSFFSEFIFMNIFIHPQLLSWQVCYCVYNFIHIEIVKNISQYLQWWKTPDLNNIIYYNHNVLCSIPQTS